MRVVIAPNARSEATPPAAAAADVTTPLTTSNAMCPNFGHLLPTKITTTNRPLDLVLPLCLVRWPSLAARSLAHSHPPSGTWPLFSPPGPSHGPRAPPTPHPSSVPPPRHANSTSPAAETHLGAHAKPHMTDTPAYACIRLHTPLPPTPTL